MVGTGEAEHLHSESGPYRQGVQALVVPAPVKTLAVFTTGLSNLAKGGNMDK